VNREVFRRAMNARQLLAQSVRIELDAPQTVPWGMSALIDTPPRVLGGRLVVWIALAAGAALALATWLLR
jgi:hypothetical protein